MPLKLNLYHEIDKQKALKRRDPLKFAGAGLVAIVIGFAGYYAFQLAEEHSLSVELSTVQAEFEKLKPKAEAAKKRETELSTSIKLSESLVKRVEGRFYWAPVLATLSSVVPHEVQVTKFSGDVSGDVTKHCSITIDGIAAGTDPRSTAEDLRKAIGDSFNTSGKYKNVSSAFKGNIEDSPELAKLGGKSLPTVDFTIIVQFQIGEDAPPPKPVYKGRPQQSTS